MGLFQENFRNLSVPIAMRATKFFMASTKSAQILALGQIWLHLGQIWLCLTITSFTWVDIGKILEISLYLAIRPMAT